MSERKVLNKYIPANFDPTKIPRAKHAKQWTVRMMLPWSVQCGACGEYLPVGRKFNTRMEPVKDENYLGIKIWRFYFRCTRCSHEFTLKTDPKNADYLCEQNCRRNFELWKTPEGEEPAPDVEEDDGDKEVDTMALLEQRTKDSLKETQIMEALEQTRYLNAKINRFNIDTLISDINTDIEALTPADEQYMRDLFAKQTIKRVDVDKPSKPRSVAPVEPAANTRITSGVVFKRRKKEDQTADDVVRPKAPAVAKAPEPVVKTPQPLSLVDY